MKIYTSPEDTRRAVLEYKMKGKRVGFVPTMGYLHEGHLSLVREIKKSCDVVVASIFVNPLQFNDPNDLLKYPIDLERDFSLLTAEGVDIVFTPKASDIYQENNQTRVAVTKLSQPLEGEFRPGHFEGVTTVVALLFNIVQPDAAIFGEKDLQQLRLIEQMVRDLHFPITIIRGALIRESDGLALSSRNVRLSVEGRKQALLLSRSLQTARELSATDRSAISIITEVKKMYDAQSAVKLEYFSIADERTLESASALETGGVYRALVAAYVEGVRLIDNMQLASI